MTAATTSLSTCFLLVLLVTGCSDSPTSPSIQYVPPSVGKLAVSVNVTGDPTVGPSAFRIYVDGILLGVAQPNEILQWQIKTGVHEVAFSSWDVNPTCFQLPVVWRFCLNTFVPTVYSWCVQAGGNQQSVAVARGGVQPVTFALDCPPLVGEGVIAVTVVPTGAAVPDEFPVVITRVNRGPPYSRTVNVPSNGSMKITLPVGVHKFSIDPVPTCQRTLSDIASSSSIGVVRNGTEVQATLRITCG